MNVKHFDEELDELLKHIRRLKQRAIDNLAQNISKSSKPREKK